MPATIKGNKYYFVSPPIQTNVIITGSINTQIASTIACIANIRFNKMNEREFRIRATMDLNEFLGS